MTVLSKLIQGADGWARLNLCDELCVKNALLAVLHNDLNDASYTGLPKNPQALYQEMVKFRSIHQKKLNNRDGHVRRFHHWCLIVEIEY